MKDSFPYTALYDKLRIHGYHDDDFDKTHLAQHIPWIKRNLNFNSVLDIGCSTGGSAMFLADDNVRVTGVDVSKIAVARARQLGRDVHHAGSMTFSQDYERPFGHA